MKKNLLYVVALVLSMGFFASCSDDDSVSPIVGSWKFDQIENPLDSTTKVPEMFINMTSPNDSVPFFGKNAPNANFSNFLIGIISSYKFLDALNSIEFLEDGNVIISYKADGEDQLIDKGMIRYYIEGDKIYLGADKKLIAGLAEVLPGLDIKKIPGIKEIGDDIAMPLMYRFVDQKLEIYVTKDMMIPFFNIISSLLPDVAFYVDATKLAVEHCTTFELGLGLIKK